MWKSQSVLDLMVSMDRFEPCICALPIDNDKNEEEKEKRVEEIVEYFSKQNVKVVRLRKR